MVGSVGSWTPSAFEVLAAVRSLYADELKPFGRILLKRVREQAAVKAGLSPSALDAIPLIDPKQLRQVCENSSELVVESTEGKEYAALLASRRGSFVDACSPVDPYPEAMWVQATAYFASLGTGVEQLPCGRYSCAQELVKRGLPFLRDRTLGEVCHIVQLAISSRKMLGYASGHLVPYSQSEESAKAKSARHQQPISGASATTCPLSFATWDDLRSGLRELLRRSRSPAPGSVTLSNVKRLFKSELLLELSETVLGYSRVCELLQDPRLHDVCRVESLGNSQALVHFVMPDYLPYHTPEQIPPCGYMCDWGHPGMLSTCASTRAFMPGPPAMAMAMPQPPMMYLPHGAGFDLGGWAPAPPLSQQALSAHEHFAWEASAAGSGPWPHKAQPSLWADDSQSDTLSSVPPCDTLDTTGIVSPSESSVGWASSDDVASRHRSPSRKLYQKHLLQDKEDEGEELMRIAPTLEGHGCRIRNTFIEVDDEEACAPSASRRSASLPRYARLASL